MHRNTHEKAQLEWVKNSNLSHKRNASISPYSNITKQKKCEEVTKTKTK